MIEKLKELFNARTLKIVDGIDHEFDTAYGFSWMKLRLYGATEDELLDFGSDKSAIVNLAIQAAIIDFSTFEDARKQKEALYTWIERAVPEWANYYAMDEDGRWYAYAEEPRPDTELGVFDFPVEGTRCERIEEGPPAIKWGESLRKINRLAVVAKVESDADTLE